MKQFNMNYALFGTIRIKANDKFKAVKIFNELKGRQLLGGLENSREGVELYEHEEIEEAEE